MPQPEPVVCNCASCRDLVKPGFIFRRLLERARQKSLTTFPSPKGALPSGRHKKGRSNLAIFLWVSARLKVKPDKGLVFRTIMWEAFETLADKTKLKKLRKVELNAKQAVRVRKYVAKRLKVKACGHCYLVATTCGCWRCGSCDTVRRADEGIKCPACNRCQECCDCFVCGTCEARVRRSAATGWCNECSRCRNCDPCRLAREEIPWTERSGRRTVLKFHGKPSARYPQYVGVEIECGSGGTGADYSMLGKALSKWNASCHGDGSITLNGGIEISTAPAMGDAFVEQVNDMCAALETAKAKVNASCGLHCHVSAKDLTQAQVLTVVRAYTKAERALFEIVAPSRRGTHYTAPWDKTFEDNGVFKDDESVVKRIARLDVAVYGSKASADAVKAQPHKHGSRYHGLNLNALLLYGTLEFRLHQGTVNAHKIQMWAAVCSAIVEYARHHPEEDVKNFAGSPMEFLMDQVLVADPDVQEWIDDRRAHFIKSDKLLKRKSKHDNIGKVEASER